MKQVVTVCKGSRAMGKVIGIGIGIENKGNADMFDTDTDTNTEKNISGAFKA